LAEIAILPILLIYTTRLDYCNSLLAGLPQCMPALLQCTQNAAARLVFKLGARDHITASLIQLHWLPVHWHIQFKLCCIMHCVFVAAAPHN